MTIYLGRYMKRKATKKKVENAKYSLNVPIAELKAKLSMYLKLVKSGKELIVTDHNAPVAKLIAFQDSSLIIHEAKFKLHHIIKFASLPATGKTDSLALLLEERGKR